MFKKLLTTVDDPTLTFMRRMPGIVFFAHGAEQALGWFGGYGFSGIMGFFTSQMHIPAPLAFLATRNFSSTRRFLTSPPHNRTISSTMYCAGLQPGLLTHSSLREGQ